MPVLHWTPKCPHKQRLVLVAALLQRRSCQRHRRLTMSALSEAYSAKALNTPRQPTRSKKSGIVVERKSVRRRRNTRIVMRRQRCLGTMRDCLAAHAIPKKNPLWSAMQEDPSLSLRCSTFHAGAIHTQALIVGALRSILPVARCSEFLQSLRIWASLTMSPPDFMPKLDSSFYPPGPNRRTISSPISWRISCLKHRKNLVPLRLGRGMGEFLVAGGEVLWRNCNFFSPSWNRSCPQIRSVVLLGRTRGAFSIWRGKLDVPLLCPSFLHCHVYRIPCRLRLDVY
jgi:hypothetical protein